MSAIPKLKIDLTTSWSPERAYFKEFPSEKEYSSTFRPSKLDIMRVKQWANQSEEAGFNEPLRPNSTKQSIHEYKNWESEAFSASGFYQTKFLPLWEVSEKDRLFTTDISILKDREVFKLAIVAMRAPYISMEKGVFKPPYSAYYNPETKIFELSSANQFYYIGKYERKTTQMTLQRAEVNLPLIENTFGANSWKNTFNRTVTPYQDLPDYSEFLDRERSHIEKFCVEFLIPSKFDRNTGRLKDRKTEFWFSKLNSFSSNSKTYRFYLNKYAPNISGAKFINGHWILFRKQFDIGPRTYTESIKYISSLPKINRYSYRPSFAIEISALFMANFVSTGTVLFPKEKGSTSSHEIFCLDSDFDSYKNEKSHLFVKFSVAEGLSVEWKTFNPTENYYMVPVMPLEN
ncbi:hypothetical protein [Candidatus Neptunochlamydia vexilliferae]|uniref:Uncharacterized protein n=1 Tax=Candidatus Neptunichlamydia vexilliferae TaxID=1651774 RepID=A0ABS0AWU9_9BACT|nr:hypothetical protein [Candidatus Neptunochlamydia vexilliferae]MBF5058603.1 hypothetical protein [Candidatus Neptunochlamydia vexilliferae]